MSEQKLKAGAVYRMERDDGSVEECLCWATIDRPGQKRAGWIQRFGLAKQIITEDAELFKRLELVKEPVKKVSAAKPPAAKKAPAVKKAARKSSSSKSAR